MEHRYFSGALQRLWSLEQVAYSIRLFIALTGAMLLCWWRGELNLVVPLFLGIIASALAEIDDSWQGRLKAVIVILICFTITSVSVTVLFPYPLLFVIGLAVTAFFLTLLGAIGSRYSAIGTATLTLSIYTMISVSQHIEAGSPILWRDTMALVIGAAWYGLLSILWNFVFVHQPVQYALSTLFNELGDYLTIKSSLTEPIRNLSLDNKSVELARKNSSLVMALNNAKETILNRVKGNRHSPQVSRYLRLYFIAQDIHERASSSHYPYNELTEAFFYSDVLFRCQRLLFHQGKACYQLAEAIQLKRPFIYDDSSEALVSLEQSIDYLKQQPQTNKRLLRSVQALAKNLTTLEQKLIYAKNPDALTDEQDINLADREVHTLKEAFIRIKQNLSLNSLVCRHALRIAIALALGYGIMHAINASYGFWILLTTVFVCRPSYGATKTRLVQRMVGTALGVIIGWSLITIFPNPIIESVIAIIAGVLFFAFRVSRYTLSTAFITIMILCCFNQVGNSAFIMIIPRLIDTFIGCAIAGMAVLFILPDWQGKRLNQVLANTLNCSSEYLKEIIQQYKTGKQDNLAYRVVRRDAHNADAALSTALASMLLEPGSFRKSTDEGFRFLVISHTMLGYLSALGAHRQQIASNEQEQLLLDKATSIITKGLNEIASNLNKLQAVSLENEDEILLASELDQLTDEMSDNTRLVLTELGLICKQLMRIRALAAQLQQQVVELLAASS